MQARFSYLKITGKRRVGKRTIRIFNRSLRQSRGRDGVRLAGSFVYYFVSLSSAGEARRANGVPFHAATPEEEISFPFTPYICVNSVDTLFPSL